MPETLLDQPEATGLGWNDILYAVIDPAGAPADRKITKANLLAAVLKALAELAPAANTMPRFTGSTTADLVDATAAGLALLGAADAAAQRTALGLSLGADVQPYDAELAALAALTSAANALPYFTGSGTAALTTLSSFVRTLLDATSADQFRGRVNAMQRLAWVDAAADTSAGDGVGVNMTTTGGSHTVTLADPTTFANSNALNAVRLAATSGSSACTVAPSAGWTIEGAASLVLRYPGEFVVLQALASGNQWRVLVDGRIHAPLPLVLVGDVTAVANRTYAIDASSANRTVLLPAAPQAHDTVGLVSAFAQGSNTITIDRNGNLLLGAAANVTLTTLGEYLVLQWDATNSVWQAVADGRLCNANRPGHVPPLPAQAGKYLDGTGVFAGFDTDTELAAASDTKIASQKATRTFVGAATNATYCARLTTQSGTAISTSDRTSQGTLYTTPFRGNRKVLYSGAAWRTFAFAEYALALTLTSGKNYDLFDFFTVAAPSATNAGTDIITFGAAQGWATGALVTVDATGGGLTVGTNYWWNAASATTGSFHATLADALAGTNKVDLTANITANVTGLSLELSAAWTNDTTRADALATQDGVTVKSGAATRRWAGTLRASGANVTEDSQAKRFVWNAYHRVPRPLYVYSNSSHTYDSTTLRQWNNASANQAEFVLGEAMTVRAAITGTISAGTASTFAATSVMLNTSIAYPDVEYSQPSGTTGVGSAPYAKMLAAGYRVLYALQRGTGAATSTFYVMAIQGDCEC